MKKIVSVFIVNTIFCSCSLFNINSVTKSKDDKAVEREKKEVGTSIKKIVSQKLSLKIGEVSPLLVRGVGFSSDGLLKCGGRKYFFAIKDDYIFSFISETYFSKMKPFDCIYTDGKNRVKVADVKIIEKQFPFERIHVNKKRVFLNKKDRTRVRKENKIKRKVYASSAKRPLFTEAFVLPIKSKVTSIYGAKRIFNKKKQTQHLGTDYRASVGNPIRSANRGRVVISRNLFYTGYTVVIDHGLNIFTTYGHLSKLLVEEGEIVPINTIIGNAGATGRVTGPHLHWGVTVNGFAVEGDSLIKASRLIFNEL